MGAPLTEESQSNTKKAILVELETYYGIVTDACKKVGISRKTFYEWLKNDPEFKKDVDDIQETAIDFVESKLFQKVHGVIVRKGLDSETGEDIVYDLPPSDTAIIFYLKTRGKKRGYIERQEITGADGGNLFADKSDEDLKQLLSTTLSKLNEGT